ncbi:MAG: winged helix-turn-helix domain-containing protein [Pigmentiphaga sp.]|nr:winged helix-turn-helix domain-containing protein [Pigmentiphaga sp.]
MSAPLRPIVIWTDDPALPGKLSIQLPHLVIRAQGFGSGGGTPDSEQIQASALVVIDARQPHSRPADTGKLARCLNQLTVHLPDAAASHQWRLIDRPCRLVAPNQHSVRLSAAEHRLLRHLMAAGPNGVVSRDDLERHAGLQTDGPPTHTHEARYRALNMRISRLRQKARRTGMHLHIEAVAREGYSLSTRVVPHAS